MSSCKGTYHGFRTVYQVTCDCGKTSAYPEPYIDWWAIQLQREQSNRLSSVLEKIGKELKKKWKSKRTL